MAYKILSPHYDGPPSACKGPKIKPRDHKSYIALPSSDEPIFIESSKGTVVLKATSDNRFAVTLENYERYGDFSRQKGDIQKFDSYLKAATDNGPSRHRLIPSMPDLMYVEGTSPLGMYFPDKGDTATGRITPRVIEAVNPNDLGKEISKANSFKQDIRDTMFGRDYELSDDATARIAYNGKKGFSLDTAKSPGIIGIGSSHRGSFASYFPEKGFLLRGKAYEKYRNIKDEEVRKLVKDSTIQHELNHHLGVHSERLQGLMEAEFYSEMAELHRGSKKGGVYEKMAQIGVEYAKAYSRLKSVFGDGNPAEQLDAEDQSINRLLNKFKIEAEVMGYCEEETESYIQARLENTLGALGSGENSASANQSSEDSSLDAIVENAQKGPRTSLRAIRGGKYKTEESYQGKESKKTRYKIIDGKKGNYKGKNADAKSEERSEYGPIKDADSGEAPDAADSDGDSAPLESASEAA